MIKTEFGMIALNAAQSRFTTQRLEALARLELYFNNPAGVGEHPQVVDEIETALRQLTEANDCLKTINNIRQASSTNTQETESGE